MAWWFHPHALTSTSTPMAPMVKRPASIPATRPPGDALRPVTLTNDIDLTATLTVAGVAAGSAAGPLSGNVGMAVTGVYGTLTLGANGAWTYALNNSDTDTNALARGEAASDVFSYTASDGHGNTSTTTVTVNITGENDAPVITGGTTTG
jgi:VCBS repeat-containing protein